MECTNDQCPECRALRKLAQAQNEQQARRAARVEAESNWNPADYYGADELKGIERERPPFGTERHRWISTVKLMQAKLDDAELGR